MKTFRPTTEGWMEMSPAVMEPPVERFATESSPNRAETAAMEIIARARSARLSMRGGLLMALSSGILLWLAFPPIDWGPLAWIALIPLTLLTKLKTPTSRMYLAVWLGGVCYWGASLQWMRLGDPTMYLAWGAMTLYLACYWPLFIGLTRIATQRYQLPLVLSAPVLWTGLEFLRAHLFTGFAWYQLGHSQYRWVEMIQISDLVGGYGVTFVVMLANACAVEFVPVHWLTWFGLQKTGDEQSLPMDQLQRTRRFALTVMLSLVSASFGYGIYRRESVEFVAGPRVALIEGNFPAYVRLGMTAEEVFKEWDEIYKTHRYLTGLSVPEQPDVIVWPEGMFRYPLLLADNDLTEKELTQGHLAIPTKQWRDLTTREILEDMSRESGASMIIGLDAHVMSRKSGYQSFNSAVLLDPTQGLKGRYDKIHRVIFGEYIPLRDALPLLQKLTPYSGDFGIDAGNSVSVFKAGHWSMVPVICFEDTVPHLVRNMVSAVEDQDEEQVDCLVNLSNDGWFWGSSELDQHLITSQFRCVETRTPMIRAVNTGISAIIDGDGVVREPDHFKDLDARQNGEPPRTTIRDPNTGQYYRQLNCALIGNVPLDIRKSLYVRCGDWFAALCLICCCGVGLTGLLPVSRRAAVEPA